MITKETLDKREKELIHIAEQISNQISQLSIEQVKAQGAYEEILRQKQQLQEGINTIGKPKVSKKERQQDEEKKEEI